MNFAAGQCVVWIAVVASAMPSEAKPAKLSPPAALNPIVSQQREVATVAGHRIRVLVGLEVNTDCSVGGATAIKVVSQPLHGDAFQSQEDIYPGFSLPNPREKCNGTKLPGVVLYYTPNGDFAGRDHLEALVSFSTGKLEDDKIDIDVK